MGESSPRWFKNRFGVESLALDPVLEPALDPALEPALDPDLD